MCVDSRFSKIWPHNYSKFRKLKSHATILLLDECDFDQQSYEIEEGDEMRIGLTFTKALPEDVQIDLVYTTDTHLSLRESCAVITMCNHFTITNYVQMCVCVRVCAWVRACVCVCVCVCVHHSHGFSHDVIVCSQ